MIPMAAFRAKHRIPDLHLRLYKPVLDQYVERYDPNGYADGVPKDKREAFQHFVKRARWQHYW